jgi:DNA replication and repair protein RecF
MTFDGSTVERFLDLPDRPLVSVFLPDRLDLIKGAPALRRAHLDQVVAGMWPARVGNRRAYGAALAQRNALLGRIRTGSATAGSLAAWDAELARHALPLMADRREAVERLAEPFVEMSSLLGLDGNPVVAYRPRSRADGEEAFVAELQKRMGSDLDRGFTGHGPHRDDLLISREGRELRTYGSQGQQRLGLLALLLAEREVIAASRDTTPLLLLDDVMSELDGSRRAALVELLRTRRGQALITTTDAEHVPGTTGAGVTHLSVGGGSVLRSLVAA